MVLQQPLKSYHLIFQVIFLSFLLVFSSNTYAEESEQISLNLKDADIRSLVATISKATGQNFVIDPRVKARVTVVTSRPMQKDELYEVFLSILQVHGFTAVDSGNVTKIIPNAMAKQLDIPLESQDGKYERDRLVTRVIPIEFISASQLVALLRPLVAQEGHLAAYPNTNILIISDWSANVQRIVELVSRIDRPVNDQIEVIGLEHVPANILVKNLTALLTKNTGKNNPNSIDIVADEWTNSVIVSGDKAHRLKIRALITQLDKPRTELTKITRVVRLHYAKPDDMANLLLSVAKNLTQKTDGQTAKEEAEITIEANEQIYALVMTGPQDVLNHLEEVIRSLDIPQPQVLVEAIIAEVSSDRLEELGIQWRLTNDFTGKSGFGGTNFDASGNSIASSLTAPLAQGNGLSVGLFDGTTTVLGTEILNIGVLLDALSGDGRSNVLSTPSLVVTDNEDAEIVVGQNVPFVTGQFSGTTSGASPNNPFQTIERKDVGLSLKVKPRITEGDAVQLKIEQEVSSVSTTTVSGAADLVTNKRSLKTKVTVKDGHILVLGGLIDDNLQENEQNVPVLSDIPLFGELFKSRKTTFVKRNLMVFIRPIILRTNGDNIAATQPRYQSIRDGQVEHNKNGVALMRDTVPPQLPEVDKTGKVLPEKTKKTSDEPTSKNDWAATLNF